MEEDKIVCMLLSLELTCNTGVGIANALSVDIATANSMIVISTHECILIKRHIV